MTFADFLRRRTLYLVAVLFAGCSQPQPPPTAETVLEQTFTAPVLYRTEDGDEIKAPGAREGAVIFKPKNTLAWETWRCENPDCPEKKPAGERPFLFIRPSPFMKVDGGKIVMTQPQNEADFQALRDYGEARCPACLKKRDLAHETPEQRSQYMQWCHKYELPEAIAIREKAAEKFREQMPPAPKKP